MSPLLVGMVLAALAATAHAEPRAHSAKASNAPLFSYSTIDALLAGNYDGALSVAELKRHGNFGLGTYNRLDGEMVALNGVFYHVHADGSIDVAAPTDKVPLAYVLPFRPTQALNVPPAASLPEMEAWLDQQLPNKNLFHAIEIHGRFTGAQTRAIAPQVRPYRPLAEVVKTQSLFDKEAVTGTLVGIRSPAFSKGISVAGYHWHFISDDHHYGGHLLKISLTQGSARIEAVPRFEVQL